MRPEYTKEHEILFLSSRGPNQKQKQDLFIERNMISLICVSLPREKHHPSDTGHQKKEADQELEVGE